MKNKHKKKVTKHRKNHADIFQDTVETLELTIRSARRCAYDLKHCADSLSLAHHRHSHGPSDNELAKIFHERADFFVKLFQSGSTMKDYRHKLYGQISDLECKLKQLRDLLAEHNIDDPTCF